MNGEALRLLLSERRGVTAWRTGAGKEVDATEPWYITGTGRE